jgi:branched-chain amino acid transport system ATP-binding protein
MLEIVELTVAYGRVPAVSGVGFSVGDGEIAALIGANGAGKTTTLAAISGLVRVASGRILHDGTDLTRLRSDQIVARGIVQVPEGRAILSRMTVAENLRLGAYQRRDRAVVERDLAGWLDRFPILAQRRAAPAGTLSGGEQQLLAIARGMMARPKLLLLDEPSLGLAPLMVQRIFAMIGEIHAAGTTLLLVEQNARQALSLADRGVVLASGRLVLTGSGAELLRDQATVDAYLGGALRVGT